MQPPQGAMERLFDNCWALSWCQGEALASVKWYSMTVGDTPRSTIPAWVYATDSSLYCQVLWFFVFCGFFCLFVLGVAFEVLSFYFP